MLPFFLLSTFITYLLVVSFPSPLNLSNYTKLVLFKNKYASEFWKEALLSQFASPPTPRIPDGTQ